LDESRAVSDFLPESVSLALGISDAATISPAPQGMTSEVAFVRDRGRESVMKRCRHAIYVEWLRREHKVLRSLSECSMRMPRVIGYHEVAKEDHIDDAWLRMTRVPGEPLWGVILCSPDERSRHLQTLGNLLRELHSVPPPEAFRHQRPWIDRALEGARQNLGWCDGSAELLAQLAATRPEPWPEALIHGDMALDNVLIDGDGNMGLIDWSGGDLGDPRYDISLALATEPEVQLSTANMAAFLAGYGCTPLDPATTRWFEHLYEFF
jgi:aminoglycoside phosphotransferase (APT) family kinase protein